MKKPFSYLFTVRSGRGTNEKTIREYDEKPSTSELKDDLEDWADCNNRAGESYTLGAKKIVVPSRKKLLKRWGPLCRKYEKIKEERDVMSAMFTVYARRHDAKVHRKAQREAKKNRPVVPV